MGNIELNNDGRREKLFEVLIKFLHRNGWYQIKKFIFSFADLPNVINILNFKATIFKCKKKEVNNMCETGKLKCRIITTFPRPFSLEKTSYSQSDFSDSVKCTCSSMNSLMNGLRMCKVIILGDVNVGKTSIVNRFCRQIFNFNYKATIGVDFEVEQFDILGIPFNMQIWDTAGQERFRCIAAAYYRSAHVIVTVFDLSNIKSLHHCPIWMKEALNSNIETPLKFLVGTKKDLLLESIYNEVEEEAAKMAKIMDAEYWAVSSRTGKGVTELFNRIAVLSFEQIIKSEVENPEKQNRLTLGQSLIWANKKNHGECHKRECKLSNVNCFP